MRVVLEGVEVLKGVTRYNYSKLALITYLIRHSLSAFHLASNLGIFRLNCS